MRVLKKTPGNPAQIVEIDNSLEAMQKVVGGYIQSVPLFDGIFLICNEEGKLGGLPHNFILNSADEVVGTAFFAGDAGEDFAAISDVEIAKVCDYFNFSNPAEEGASQ
jgi:hypothetical protein